MPKKFEIDVKEKTEKALEKMRRWDKEQGAKELMREYLSGQGLLDKSKTKLDELLDERTKIALQGVDENIRLKAIDSALMMATGNEKVQNNQFNQFNFNDFVDGLKD